MSMKVKCYKIYNEKVSNVTNIRILSNCVFRISQVTSEQTKVKYQRLFRS